jgi:hypothetical protein
MRFWDLDPGNAVGMSFRNPCARRLTMMRKRHLILLAFTILVMFVAAITIRARKAADWPSINSFSARGAEPSTGR